MSRTQDLVLARLRLLAGRWRSDRQAARPGPAAAAPAGLDDPVEDQDRSDPPGAVGALDGDPGPLASDAVEPAIELQPRTPARVWVQLLAVLALIVVAAAAVMLVRTWPRPVPQIAAGAMPVAGAASSAPVVAAVVPGDAGPAVAPSGGPASTNAAMVVHVAGDVRHPGLVVLPQGARVGDALEAAGGLRKGGNVGATNLARVLTDGERVEIGATSDPAGGSAAAGGGAADAASGASAQIDLNTATAEQLDSLPGIGPVTASKILAWRTEHGRFSVVDELAEVPGIGPKTLAELRSHVRV